MIDSNTNTEQKWEVTQAVRTSRAVYLVPVMVLVAGGLIALVRILEGTNIVTLFVLPGLFVTGLLAAYYFWSRKQAAKVPDVNHIRIQGSQLYIDPNGRPIPLLRANLDIGRAYVTPDSPYGSKCIVSERGMPRVWRILSDVELTTDHYSMSETTDTNYDLYMAPDAFKGFVDALRKASLREDHADQSPPGDISKQGADDSRVFEAAKQQGGAFILLMVTMVSGTVIGLGMIAYLISRLFPDSTDTIMMVMVLASASITLGTILVAARRKGRKYRLEVSPGKLVLTCLDREDRIVIDIATETALRKNWIATGNQGSFRVGPALEFHNDNRKVRIGTQNPELMWDEDVSEVGSVQFVVSRDAWEYLLKIEQGVINNP
jgi:hypothetical protein